MKKIWSRDDLVELKAKHAVLAAIDSDGCVFDSMTIKQRIFHAGIIQFWSLEAAEKEVRDVAEWVSLFSPWRGLNRFQLLLQIFKWLDRARAVFPALKTTPPVQSLEAFVHSGVPLSADELAKRIEKTGDTELQRVLDWSTAVSAEIAAIAEMPVFSEVMPALEKIREATDAIVVSQTAEEALVREWNHAGLTRFVDVIAGAELGSKAESLGTAMTGRYAQEQTVMIGDAPGDLETARATGSLFFPIIPGAEDDSWIELRDEGLRRIHDGTFIGAYQEELILRFNAALSDRPPWEA